MTQAMKVSVLVVVLALALLVPSNGSGAPAAAASTNSEEQLSLFQREQILTKSVATLGLIDPEGSFVNLQSTGLSAWLRLLDTSTAIDLLFLVLVLAMLLRWHQMGTQSTRTKANAGDRRRPKKDGAPAQPQVAPPPSEEPGQGGMLTTRLATSARLATEVMSTAARRRGNVGDTNEEGGGGGLFSKRQVGKASLELHEAVKTENLSLCLAALKKPGVSLEQTDPWLCTPLHLAAHRGSVLVVEWLISKGARVRAVDAWDQTPLHFAAQAGHARVCEILIGHGAEMAAFDATDRTPLFLAGDGGHVAASEVLLRRGATLGNKSESHVPPLLNNLILQHMFEELGKPRNFKGKPSAEGKNSGAAGVL